MTVRRVGLFGGTFDPPHLGHVAALRAAADTGRFERIVVTVAGDPYLKRERGVVLPASLRLAMAEAAFAALPLVQVSDREIRRDGPSYTIDTVRELLGPCGEVDLLIGADLIDQLATWHEAEVLATLVRVGVVPRNAGPSSTIVGWRIYDIAMEPVDLSSSFIRELTPTSENLHDFLPDEVVPLYVGYRG